MKPLIASVGKSGSSSVVLSPRTREQSAGLGDVKKMWRPKSMLRIYLWSPGPIPEILLFMSLFGVSYTRFQPFVPLHALTFLPSRTITRAVRRVIDYGRLRERITIWQLFFLYALAKHHKSASLRRQLEELFVARLRSSPQSYCFGRGFGTRARFIEKHVLAGATGICQSLIRNNQAESVRGFLLVLLKLYPQSQPILEGLAASTEVKTLLHKLPDFSKAAFFEVLATAESKSISRKHQRFFDPDGKYLSREALVAKAEKLDDLPQVRPYIKFLITHKNFRSAFRLVENFEWTNFGVPDKILAASLLRKVSRGQEADDLLKETLNSLRTDDFDISLCRGICDALRQADLGNPSIKTLSEDFINFADSALGESRSPSAAFQRERLELFLFDFRKAQAEPHGVPTEIPESITQLICNPTGSESQFLVSSAVSMSAHLRGLFGQEAVEIFLLEAFERFSSHQNIALRILAQIDIPRLQETGLDFLTWSLDRRHWPGMMAIRFSPLVEEQKLESTIRQAARSFWLHSEGPSSFFQLVSPLVRDKVITILSGIDVLGAARLATWFQGSNIFLSWQLVAAIDCLYTDRFAESAALSGSVLEENASNADALSVYASSKRRLGEPESVIQQDLETIGFGEGSFGRPGEVKPRALHFSRKMQGDHSGRPVSLTEKRQCQRIFGDKFLHYGEYPVADKTSRLLVIPVAGVSDEVRAAQFYEGLQSEFQSVTVICDPRWAELFAQSFPYIDFVPFGRQQKKGRMNSPSLAEFGPFGQGRLPKNILQCVENVDCVTFDQNLMHEYLNGVRPRPFYPRGYLAATARGPGEGAASRRGGVRNIPRRLQVGLTWRSSVITGLRPLMYYSALELQPILELPGIDFHSLQEGLDSDELEILIRHGVRIADVDLSGDFTATARYINNLDLVIGTGTLQPEIAAAVGVPVWLLSVSPEEYFLRTKGGSSRLDILTQNTLPIGPADNNFARERVDVVNEIVESAVIRLLSMNEGGYSRESFLR